MRSVGRQLTPLEFGLKLDLPLAHKHTRAHTKLKFHSWKAAGTAGRYVLIYIYIYDGNNQQKEPETDALFVLPPARIPRVLDDWDRDDDDDDEQVALGEQFQFHRPTSATTTWVFG